MPPMPPRRRADGKRVIVVGAGIAGIAAAMRLSEDGAVVTLLEALDRPGGRAYATKTVAWDAPQELGAQFLSDHYATLLPMFASVSAPEELVLAPLPSRVALVVGGTPRTTDREALDTFVTSGAVGRLDMLAMALAAADVASGVRQKPLDDLSAWEHEDGENARSWLVRNYGRRGADFVGGPAVQSLFFLDPSRTSSALVHWLISMGDRSRRLYTNAATNHAMCVRLVEVLRERGVEVLLGQGVTRVEEAHGRVRVHTAADRTIDGDAAIVTAPGPIAREIVEALGPAQAASAAQGYASTIVVNIVVDRVDPMLRSQGRVYGVAFPRAEVPGGIVAGCSVESGKTDREHGGRELYGFHLHDEAARRLAGEPDAAIVGAVVAEAGRFMPDVRTHFVDAVVQRWEHAIPYMAVGVASRCKNLWEEQRASPSRILLAGDHTTIATLDGAAHSGVLAAATVTAKLALAANR